MWNVRAGLLFSGDVIGPVHLQVAVKVVSGEGETWIPGVGPRGYIKLEQLI